MSSGVNKKELIKIILEDYKEPNKVLIENTLNKVKQKDFVRISMDDGKEVEGKILTLFYPMNQNKIPYAVQIDKGETDEIVPYKNIKHCGTIEVNYKFG